MLRCPLCQVLLEPSAAEGHIRDELDAPELRCLLCRLTFFDRQDAQEHFRGPLAWHPGFEPQLVLVRLEPAKKARLVELLVQVKRELCDGNTSSSAGADSDPTLEQKEPSASFDVVSKQDKLRSDDASDSGRDETRVVPSYDSDAPALPEEAENEADVKDVSLVIKLDSLSPDSQNEYYDAENEGYEAEELGKGQTSQHAESFGVRVTCRLCDRSVKRSNVALHAKSFHMNRPFHCLICSYQSNIKPILKLHLRKVHSREVNSETFRSDITTEQVRVMVANCFDLTADPKVPCSDCQMRVHPRRVRSHCSAVHLKAVMHRCRLCPYTTMSATKQHVMSHVKTVHKGAPVERSIDSSGLAKHHKEIKAAVAKFFPNN